MDETTKIIAQYCNREMKKLRNQIAKIGAFQLCAIADMAYIVLDHDEQFWNFLKEIGVPMEYIQSLQEEATKG